MQRYAMVQGDRVVAETVAQYLPKNYRVVWHGPFPNGIDKEVPTVVIQGEDDHGWRLDTYVLPRLGSGGMNAKEIDLSHPVMKHVPVVREWPGIPDSPLAKQYPNAALAVRLLETTKAGSAMFDTGINAPVFKTSKAERRVDVLLDVLKAIGRVAQFEQPGMAMDDVLPQMDTEDFRRYVEYRLRVS